MFLPYRDYTKEVTYLHNGDTLTVTLSETMNATLRYYRAYRSSEFMLRRTSSENEIVIFDHGLHYPPNEEVETLSTETQDILNFMNTYEASHSWHGVKHRHNILPCTLGDIIFDI